VDRRFARVASVHDEGIATCAHDDVDEASEKIERGRLKKISD
jgi:hypothetical protein